MTSMSEGLRTKRSAKKMRLPIWIQVPRLILVVLDWDLEVRIRTRVIKVSCCTSIACAKECETKECDAPVLNNTLAKTELTSKLPMTTSVASSACSALT